MPEKNIRLVQLLKKQAQAIVENFDYLSVMVACLEKNGDLCIYAYYIDPNVASEDWLRKWEQKLSTLFNKKLTLLDSSIARINIHDDSHKENLASQAIRAGKPVASEDLYTLFKPVLPKLAEPFTKSVQMLAGIEEVISVPFFSSKKPDVLVGNFFAIRRSKITATDREILDLFGHKFSEVVESRHPVDKEQSDQQLAQDSAHSSGSATHEKDLTQSFPADLPKVSDVELKDIMIKYFKLDELIGVCFELQLDHENLAHDTKPILVMNMIRYTQKNGCYERLCTILHIHRPHAFDSLIETNKGMQISYPC